MSAHHPSGSPTTFRKTMNQNHSEHFHHNHGDDTSQHKHSHGDHGSGVAALAGKYTCPMHPEIVSDMPGDCPKCGMALEPMAAALPKTIYTCPMHPEIEQDHPGDCPICGMRLEPKTVSAEDSAEHAEIHVPVAKILDRPRVHSARAFPRNGALNSGASY